MKAVRFMAAVACLTAPGWGGDVAERVRADAAHEQPLVVHVVVALCDNLHQGIVPVPRLLGNGQDPAHNLYWGARFGVKTYFAQAGGWKTVRHTTAPSAGVLERVVFRSTIRPTRLFVVADAWNGSCIREAISAFLEMAAGRRAEAINVENEVVQAGGRSHVVVFLGHNGLMDFRPPPVATGSASPARAAVVLACASKPYFGELLNRCRAYPLLLTTGLMAPEGYSLEAAVRSWFSTTKPSAVREAAAEAYSKYQGCSRRAARRLFSAELEK